MKKFFIIDYPLKVVHVNEAARQTPFRAEMSEMFELSTIFKTKRKKIFEKSSFGLKCWLNRKVEFVSLGQL